MTLRSNVHPFPLVSTKRLRRSTGLGPPSPELYRHATLPHAPRTVLQRLGRVYWFDNLALTFEPCPSESAGYSSPSTKHVAGCSDFWQRLLTVYAGAEAYSRRLMPQDTHPTGVKKRDPRFWVTWHAKRREKEAVRQSGERYFLTVFTTDQTTRGNNWCIFPSRNRYSFPRWIDPKSDMPCMS